MEDRDIHGFVRSDFIRIFQSVFIRGPLVLVAARIPPHGRKRGLVCIHDACSHGLAARCDWRIIAVVRGGIAFVLTAWLARAGGIPVIFRWPATLWMRSIVGSFEHAVHVLRALGIASRYRGHLVQHVSDLGHASGLAGSV